MWEKDWQVKGGRNQDPRGEEIGKTKMGEELCDVRQFLISEKPFWTAVMRSVLICDGVSRQI